MLKDYKNAINNNFFISVSTFQVDFYISGIAPLENQLVLLGCSKELDENGKSERPKLHVVKPNYQDFSIVGGNYLTLRGYKEYSCNDYHLDCLKEENRYIFISLLFHFFHFFICIKIVLIFTYLYLGFLL